MSGPGDVLVFIGVVAALICFIKLYSITKDNYSTNFFILCIFMPTFLLATLALEEGRKVWLYLVLGGGGLLLLAQVVGN